MTRQVTTTKRCRNRWAAFAGDSRGATAVEFALVAAPFLALIIALIQTFLVFFAQQMLETVVRQSARLVMTGQVQSAQMNQAVFKQKVCDQIVILFNCSGLMVDMQVATSWSSANTATPTLTFDGSGNVTNSWQYNPGDSGDIVVLRVMYVWPVVLGPLGLISRTLAMATGCSCRPPRSRTSQELPDDLRPVVSRSADVDRLRAVAATEFAIVTPFMLVLYVGGVELGNGLAMNVKVSATAHSVADMISQNTAVTSTQMDGILAAASSIMAPYPIKNGSTSLMTITVSEVSTDSNGNATVQWSKSTSTSGARAAGQQMTLSSFTAPGGTSNANISLILSEVSYDYAPNLGFTIAGTVKLSDSYYLFPRCSTNTPATSSFPYYDVKYPAAKTCTCVQHLQQKTC